MKLQERILILTELGNRLSDLSSDKVKYALNKAYQENQWFTPENIEKSILSICEHFLNQEKLENWVAQYEFHESTYKNVALILAGNIPLVGFHDILATFITGHRSIIKPATKDKALVELVVQELIDIDSKCNDYFEIIDRLTSYDAVICTGSNNTANHFEFYFKDYPRIIRKNRTSIAILNGEESEAELKEMGTDIFDYFGLGCRNISKIYLPKGFNTDRIFEALIDYIDIGNHNKYKNNYDYNEAIWLMGQAKFLTNGFIILKEEESLHSRIGSLHYEYYDSIDDLTSKVNNLSNELQCITTDMSLPGINTLPLGKCQSPELHDYADGVDTIDFLINL